MTEQNSDRPRAALFECPPQLKGLRILVVDDEAETRELVSFVIEQCEAKVSQAASAREALFAMEREHFDLLVSDIGMPEIDGYTLMRLLRQRQPSAGGNIPALALTAYARPDDRTQALKAGFSMHMAKPIDPTELLVVLATLSTQLRAREAPTP